MKINTTDILLCGVMGFFGTLFLLIGGLATYSQLPSVKAEKAARERVAAIAEGERLLASPEAKGMVKSIQSSLRGAIYRDSSNEGKLVSIPYGDEDQPTKVDIIPFVKLGCMESDEGFEGFCPFVDGSPTRYWEVVTAKGIERWQITHGLSSEDYPVREGYRLVSCYCDQEECVMYSPDTVQKIVFDGGVGYLYVEHYQD